MAYAPPIEAARGKYHISPLSDKDKDKDAQSKQRGIYSEVLGRSSSAARAAAVSGPSPKKRVAGAPFRLNLSHQKAPRAVLFGRQASGLLEGPGMQKTLEMDSKGASNMTSSSNVVVANPPKMTEVEPKVMVPYKQRTGMPPRRIEIERKKRLYASQDLEKLLLSRGVDYTQFGILTDHSTGQRSYLPLHVFDNTEFEVRSPEEWIRLGSLAGGERGCVISARALPVNVFDESKYNVEATEDRPPGRYEKCDIVGWDAKKSLFRIRWRDGSNDELLVPRIYILFDVEDARLYTQRVAAAHHSRRMMEASIRYSLYVDSMPTDEKQHLDTEQVNRILMLALNTVELKNNSYDNSVLLNEVNIDFACTMNKIIFDTNLNDASQAHLKDLLKLPPAKKKTLARYLGVVKVPQHDFPKHFSDFCFYSVFTKNEAINSLVQINAQCLNAQALQLYHMPITKTVRLEEFVALQASKIAQVVGYLKVTWIQALKDCIKSSLRDVGKGWLNLQESNREVYQFSKLKKLLTMISFMMADSLKLMVQKSLAEFLLFFTQATRYNVVVEGLNQVEVKVTTVAGRKEFQRNKRAAEEAERQRIAEEKRQAEEEAAKAAALKKIEEEKRKKKGGREEEVKVEEAPAEVVIPLVDTSSLFPHPKLTERMASDVPLYAVDLVIQGNEIIYSTPPDRLLEAPLKAFNKALDSLQDIPQLETFVMEQLFWTGVEAKLAAVQSHEQWVLTIYETVEVSLRESLEPMSEFVKYFAQFQRLLELNVDDYVNSFSWSTMTTREVRSEIQIHTQAAKFLEECIPKQAWLGAVLVSCEDVKHKLVAKCNLIALKEQELFSKAIRSKCQSVDKELSKISAELKKVPEDIKALTKLNETADKVPECVEKEKPGIREAMENFSMLDEFGFILPKELFRLKWTTYQWPKKMHDQVKLQKTQMNQSKDTFLADMKTEQEGFMADIEAVSKQVAVFAVNPDIDKIARTVKQIEDTKSRLNEMANKAKDYTQNEMLFNVPQEEMADYSKLSALSKKFEPYYDLWTTTYSWMQKNEEWTTRTPFMELNGDEIFEFVTSSTKAIAKVLKAKQIKDNQGLNNIAMNCKKELELFKPKLPLIQSLRNPGMRERHWKQLSSELPVPYTPDPGHTLNNVVNDFKLMNYINIIKKIGDNAGKEFQIESTLDKMELAWKSVDFTLAPYKDPTPHTFIIKSVDETMTMLDEHIVMISAMTTSEYKEHFEARIIQWKSTLTTVADVIQEMLKVQSQWMSLEAIFSSRDIQRQLPHEYKRFHAVNKTWLLTMAQTQANPNVIGICDSQSLLAKMQDAFITLQSVNKRLAEYLDKKRSIFARFYFLANEDLLQILSQTQDPKAVQPHLKKCFENVTKLDFDEKLLITHMYSDEGEQVEFMDKVDPKPKGVEYWLGEVELEMKKAVKNEIKKACDDYYQVERVEWVRKWIGQAVLNGSQIFWTSECEQGLNTAGHKGIKAYFDKLNAQMADMVVLVRQELTSAERMIIGALIVLDVHAKDVIEELVREGVSAVTDFGWVKQMRYYLEDQLWVQMVQSRFPYGYEYLGNSPRLVITPLTDRCYMTLMTALHLHLGGAPAGPAGTGKTETTKDLAKAVAKQCVVFNCSDGLSAAGMGVFFKGLASSGAWACFDEFNRIDIEVLSVIAQQIMTIWDAIREGKVLFTFEESELKLDPTCSCFITMNPGYAGRTELPDNLKALFRPVAMMVPDYTLIAEISLYSFGFDGARGLARKMTSTFSLASQQLSVQDHYDYGMRAVKTTITRAGLLKREEPLANEQILLLRSLRDVNVPKFLEQDLPLFEGIISDLFPGIARPVIDMGVMVDALAIACNDFNLQAVPSFIEKCIQLYETTVVRHGLMLVGPTGGGKTCCLKTLASALGKMSQLPGFEKVNLVIMNPKAVTISQLYGYSDPLTKDWTDGVLAKNVRDAITVGNTSTVRQWLVFDGPVDALWIENMNTVLDDNKKLCLFNGSVLTLTQYMRMIFEVEDLAVASPATVSRCGMVYMEPTPLGSKPLIQSWLNKLHENFAPVLPTLQYWLEQIMDQSISYLKRFCKEPVLSVANNLTRSCLNILSALFVPYSPKPGVRWELADELEKFCKFIEPLILLSIIWSVGATCNMEGRIKFSDFLHTFLRDIGFKFIPPSTGLIYDYYFSIETGEWTNWTAMIKEVKQSASLTYSDLIIPTIDSVRYIYFLSLLTGNDSHVLFTGETGTGKTVNVNMYLGNMNSKCIPIPMVFSAATTCNQVELFLNGKMNRRRARVYGPDFGSKFMIFIDDLNMPARETYFAQPAIEILREWMDYGGWWSNKELEFWEHQDCVFISAMGPPGGGRNPMTNRMLRHFNQIAHTEIEDQSLRMIFSKIMVIMMDKNKFETVLNPLVEPLVAASVKSYRDNLLKLRPTPARSHYTFNLRDLSAVFQGILSSNPKTVTDPDQFVRLWVHENQRTFKDRLINDGDRTWLDENIARNMEKYLEKKWSDVIGDCTMYGYFLDGPSGDHKNYDPCDTFQKATKVMHDFLEAYNDGDELGGMQLVLFRDAVDHCARIARVLKRPGGNALLLGVGGSGRQSVTRLATFMCGYEFFQINVQKRYGLTEWRDDMKSLLMTAALKEEPTVFCLVDTQISNDLFLEDVNGILNSGDISNLYKADEMEKIVVECTADCSRKGIPPTKNNAFAQYLLRVKANVHVILCMSPMEAKFRNRLRMFPALVNCCTIDWFSAWPADALINVASHAMQEEDLKLTNPDRITTMFQAIHSTVSTMSDKYLEEERRYNYVIPTSFLEQLNTFKELLKQKRLEVGDKKNKLEVGLTKLFQAEGQVAKLKEELIAKQPVLEATKIQVDETTIVVTKNTEEAEKTKAIVSAQEENANVKAAECKGIADEADGKLKVALPALDEALKDVKKLEIADINTVRTYPKPSEGAVNTATALVIILGKMFGVSTIFKTEDGKKTKDYWAMAKKDIFANPRRLMAALVPPDDKKKYDAAIKAGELYDRDAIPDSTIDELTKWNPKWDRTSNPLPLSKDSEDIFLPDAVFKGSQPCKGLCLWARAMYQYYFVAKEVEPLRRTLAVAQGELAVVLAALNEATEALNKVKNQLNDLTKKKEALVAQKEALEADVTLCGIKIVRANKLVGGLGGEKVRWTQTVADLNVAFTNIIGDVLISAGTVAYLGAFTGAYRNALVETWRSKLDELGIPRSANPNLINTFGDPLAIRAWQIAGLPTDAVSTENGVVISKARRYNLMIDPQGQASKFIKNLGDNKESGAGIEIFKLNDKKFTTKLEISIQMGKWVLIDQIGETLDPSLDPILAQNWVMQGGQPHVKMGDKLIQKNEKFNIYMCTRLPNPHYSPELQAKVTLLNFMITPAGLEDQMLGRTVAKEAPELEQEKSAQVVKNAAMNAELAKLEREILQQLSSSGSDILEDENLINTLSSSQATAVVVTQALADAAVVEKRIDASRKLYIPVSVRASLLYFCISDLAKIDPMYQYSLQWFVGLFLDAVDAAEPAPDNIEQRVQNLNNTFTFSLYQNVCRSLFEIHKSLFAFLMTIKIQENAGIVDSSEWRFLVAGAPPSQDAKNPAPAWITNEIWNAALSMSDLKSFTGYHQSFVRNLNHFKKIFESNSPDTEPLPEPWESKLDDFQKLIVLKGLRPDKMTPSILRYIAAKLGSRFNDLIQLNLNISWKASKNITPLIFVLSTGADPASKLFEFAKEKGFRDKLAQLSLGQGQGRIATNLINDAVKKGGWVFLQNCHLAISWMPSLEQICNDFNPDEIHEDFRLWLSSSPTPKFPVSILQNGIKMTDEPPKGLRANILGQYRGFNDAFLSKSTKPDPFRKLLFSLCFFHAVILERRKFGPLGWNIMYEFTEPDLKVCITQLQDFLDIYKEIPYTVLHFLFYDVNYGGRVTDGTDRRTIRTILDDFMHPTVVDTGHPFSPSGRYISNDFKTQAEYIDYIEKFPLSVDPEVFGMHQNADITSASAATVLMFETILGLMPRSSGKGGQSKEDIVAAVVVNTLNQVPQGWELEAVQKKYPTLRTESMNTVLMQEAFRYNRLLDKMTSTLRALDLGLKGEVVMTAELEAMSTSLFNNQVPKSWSDTAIGYPSLMPLSAWVSDLRQRVAFIQKWVDNGKPVVFWISGVFFPQAFLTGTLQNFARSHTVAVDSLSFGFSVLDVPVKEIKTGPQDGVYIYGLFLEGARWDASQHSLADSRPRELFTPLPVMWLLPQAERKEPTTGVYKCPVYKELSRQGTLSTTGHSTNFVLFVELPSNENQTKWIKAGVALFCALRYQVAVDT